MLSVTIGIGREISFQAHNVLAMTVAFHIGRDKDETLALAMVVIACQAAAREHSGDDEEAAFGWQGR